MEAPIEVLRIDHNTLSKELARFRPCDNETRCFYCREWALYIYKKHFVWSAKTQEDIPTVSATPMKAGVYKVNFREITEALEKKPKAHSVTQQFQEAAEGSGILDIIQACQKWMSLPSANSGIPNLFRQVEFNSFPDNIPLVNDEKDPSHMLDPLIIERQALSLPSDGFYLLKNLTSDILLSHSQPTCQHTKPESKLPNDLEMDRAIFNENAAIAVKKALVDVGTALDQSWGPLNQFIGQLKEHIAERNNLLGETGCQKLMDDFFAGQKYQPFVDYWTAKAPAYAKNKKALTKDQVEALDRMVIDHFEMLKEKVHEFISSFVTKHLDKLGDLTSSLWKLISVAINEMNQRIQTLESLKEIQNEIKKEEADGQPVKKLDQGKLQSSLEKVSTAANPLKTGDNSSMRTELEKLLVAYKKEIDDLVASYLESSNRLDKLNNKEFKKRIKKVESGYYTLRQHFRTDIIAKVFPDPLFCRFVIVCLESLMQEGELMESFTLHKKIKEFGDVYRDLQAQRFELLNHFEQGVHTGRRELAGILGKLFLKEGMRIQGESLALKRQNSLLKSMGVNVDEESGSKKKKKKKKGAVAAATITTTATPPKSSTPTPSVPGTPIEAVANSPVVPDFVAEAIAPPVKQEESEEVVVAEKPKEKVQPKKKSAPLEDKKEKPKPVASPQPVAVVKETKEKVKEVNSIEEWKNKNAHRSVDRAPVTGGWNTVPVKSSTPEIQDWGTLKSELKQTEDSNGWASIAQTDDMDDIPKYVPKKKPEPPKGEEWPSIGPSKETTGDARPAASSGWSNIVNKSTPKSTATSTPTTASPSKPATPTVGAEEWPAVNPSAEKKVSKWPAVSKSPATQKKSSDGGWSAPVSQEKPSDGGWSSPVTQEKPSDGGWSTPATHEKPTNGGWSSSAQEKSSNGGWSSPSASNANKSTNQGWSTATQPANDNWSTPPAEPITIDLTAQTNAEPVQTDGWTTNAPAKPTNESWSNKPSESTQTGWSTTAAADAEPKKNDWSKPSKDVANSSWTTNTAELDKEWSPQVTENTTSAWNSSKKSRETSNSGWSSTPASETNNSSWGAKVKSNRWATKNDSSENLGGWGVISNASSTAGGNNNSNNAWDQNEPTASSQWGKEASTATVPSSWDPTSSGTSEWENRSNSDNWRQKNDQNKATSNDRNSNAKWDNSQLPWDNVSSTPTEEPRQQQSTPPPPSIPQDNSNNAAIMNRPPGLPMNEAPASSITSSNATITAPLPQSTPFVMATEPAPFATPSPASVPDPLQTAAIAMLSAAQLQAPLPPNLDELGSDNLILLARNLHNQNSQLIQTVYSMQSETTMMTRRYTDIITLTREKEQQTMQLLEARRQTDLEEARRYVLGLEARIKQLEQTKTTAGFGNQDLFAGYRDEMGGRPQQNRRKMWSKHYSLRCGNCGQEGHASNDCTSLCRYCGNSDHLSDACPNNT